MRVIRDKVGKHERHEEIRRILRAHKVSTQQELADRLAVAGIEVTQATLSRDLRSLGVGKRPGPQGRPTYQLPGPAAETFDRERQRLDLRAFVNEVRIAQNLSIVRTPPGHANGVARAIDLENYAGVVGTVAGDDTVLVIAKTAADARALARELSRLIG